MNKLPDFIVIDDDPVNNRICQIVIQKTFPDAVVQTYTEPEKALEKIAVRYNSDNANKAILLLDINMPTLNGWDVLEQFAQFPLSLIDKFRIYILSSSVDTLDKERAAGCQLVCDYIEKPLNNERTQMLSVDIEHWA